MGKYENEMGIGGVCDRLPELYAWQHEAYEAWDASGRCGIVEAVTGTGKTMLGVAAIGDAVAEGRRAAVLVPTKELQRQWRAVLRLHLPGHVRIGNRGDGQRDDLQSCDVVVSVINSAREASLRPPVGSLLVADECHRYASPHNRTAFCEGFEQRLGLTATLERPDRLERHLTEYLGRTCFTIGYAQAISDEVTAHFTVGLIGVPMTNDEQSLYDGLSKRLGELTRTLVSEHHFPAAPFHKFMHRVKEVAEQLDHPARGDAQALLATMHARRQLMATSPSKIEAAGALAPAIQRADRTLVFTDSIETAEDVCDLLADAGVAAETLHSEHNNEYRRYVLRDFAHGELQAVVAPRVLDEGIDVPAADLAVVVAGSRTRRQMVQRLGRVLRRKEDGRLARLAILFLETTVEDPRCGGHEVFLSEALSVAEEYKIFNLRGVGQAIEFLSDFEPSGPQPRPRRRGEPAERPSESNSDDSFDVATVLGVPALPQTAGGPKRRQKRRHGREEAVRPAPVRVPPLPAVMVDRLRGEMRRAHSFITATEWVDFNVAIARLVTLYGEASVVAGIRQSPAVAEIERVAGSVARRSQELGAAARRARQREARDHPTRISTSEPYGTADDVRPDRSSAAGERRPQPICPSCGGPETRCACSG